MIIVIDGVMRKYVKVKSKMVKLEGKWPINALLDCSLTPVVAFSGLCYILKKVRNRKIS